MAREIRTEMLDTLPRRNPHRNARTRRQRGWGNPHGVQDTHQQAEIHTRGARTQLEREKSAQNAGHHAARNPHGMLDTGPREEIQKDTPSRGSRPRRPLKASKFTYPHKPISNDRGGEARDRQESLTAPPRPHAAPKCWWRPPPVPNGIREDKTESTQNLTSEHELDQELDDGDDEGAEDTEGDVPER